MKSVDAFVLTNLKLNGEKESPFLILFQMTVAKSHPVLLKGLTDVMNIVKEKYSEASAFQTLLVFLTPPAVFTEWNVEQTIYTSKGEKAARKVCVQQVWCLQKRDSDCVWKV
jgi:hypothetical protein